METVLHYHVGKIVAQLQTSQRTLTDGIAFDIHRGESFAVIGETGSGKTMTALSVMKLLPPNVETVDSEILFLGKPLPDEGKMRKLLGVEIVSIPQNGLEFLNPSRKIRHQLYDNLKKLGAPRGQWEKIAKEKLALAGLEQPERVMNAYPFQLSGGMAQRVTIAIAACSRAKLVIADEPTNGLDYQAKLAFQQLLKKLFPEAALLIITHDITVASFCDRVLVLCGGRMMETGPSNQVLEHPRHPYTEALLSALVENGMQETPMLRGETGVCPFYRRCPHGREQCKTEREYHREESVEWWCSR